MKINCAHNQVVELHKLVPHPKNPNKHPEDQIKRLAKIIDYQGQRAPIVVSKRSGFITKGHGRLEALKMLGWEKAAVDYQDYNDEAQEYADIVADNAIASWAELQYSQINTDILDLGPELDIEMLGIKDFVLEPVEKIDPQTDPDEVPEVKFPISTKGDVWILGNHRLMCGDSTMIDDVEKLMNGEKADMLLTDPPYNVAYTGKTKEAMTIQNDSMNDDRFREFLVSVYGVADIVMRPGAAFYIWHADLEGYNFRGAARDVGWKVRQCLIWVKQTLVMGRQDYHWKHEPCLYGWKDGVGHTWTSDRKQTTVLEFDKPSRNNLHPTMKPVNLFEYQIGNNTNPKDIVLDLFIGSGATIIAAQNTGRRCFGMELDEKYCDVAIKRWEEYTGLSAILESTGQTYEELISERMPKV